MGYSGDFKKIPVRKETHKRLLKLKENGDCTFNDVVRKLLDFEDRNNMPKKIYEYEYLLENGQSKLFRIIYSDSISIEYYNYRTHDFERNIKAWTTGNYVSEHEIYSFIHFIVQENSLYELYEMDEELVQNDIFIRRVLA